jgi:hypothetical protein
MTFKSLAKTLFESGVIFGSPDFFGVTASYDPKNGVARNVNGRGVFAKDEDVVFGGVVTTEAEVLWWTCCKDPTCDAGGIDSPQLGEMLVRDGLDQPNNPWAFAGQIRNETAGGWDLLFQRNRVRRYGPKQ